jgi:dihydrofolate synthase/folylpolyglutamate synthase
MTPWPNGPALLLDGAHNPAAARALSAVLKDLAPQRVHLVIGVMSDKDAAGIIRPFLTPEVDLYLTRPVYERAAAPQRLARAAADFNGWSRLFSRLPEAIDQARRRAAPEDLIVVTGSLFTVGEAKAYLDGAPEGRLAV